MTGLMYKKTLMSGPYYPNLTADNSANGIAVLSIRKHIFVAATDGIYLK